jgi:uncharacterized membrane protein YphA (DoxX/SURF4 family)
MFYGMLPDIEGRQRLGEAIEVKKKEDKDGRQVDVTEEVAIEKADGFVKLKLLDFERLDVADHWGQMRDNFVAFYNPGKGDADLQAQHEKLTAAADAVCEWHKAALREYLTDEMPNIRAYFGSLERFDKEKQGADTSFQQERNWNRMMKLRKEAAGWLTELRAREAAFKNDLRLLLVNKAENADLDKLIAAEKGKLKEKKKVGEAPKADLVVKQPDFSLDLHGLWDHKSGKDAFAASWNPFLWERTDQINFAVTYGITAIGLCLILGLFTRPAALGGALFMAFVVMTQPAWPSIYPHDLPQLGHALLINKDFIEMLVLVFMATTAVGRWGGLDYFVNTLVVAPFLSKTICCRKKQEGQAS